MTSRSQAGQKRVTSGSQARHKWVTSRSQADHKRVTGRSQVGHRRLACGLQAVDRRVTSRPPVINGSFCDFYKQFNFQATGLFSQGSCM